MLTNSLLCRHGCLVIWEDFSAATFCEIALSDKIESYLVGARLENLLPPNSLSSITLLVGKLCLSRRARTQCLASLSSDIHLRLPCVISSGYQAAKHSG